MRNPQRKELIGGESDNDDDGEGDGVRIPPHEFLAKQSARTRTASFSVHEGIGRTLKGRDLSRVRNAVWQKIGFEDQKKKRKIPKEEEKLPYTQTDRQ